jgi:hypothetical protein
MHQHKLGLQHLVLAESMRTASSCCGIWTLPWVGLLLSGVGHDKPELSLSGNAGDSLADYDADFLQCSTTWLVLYHSYVGRQRAG